MFNPPIQNLGGVETPPTPPPLFGAPALHNVAQEQILLKCNH